MRTDSILSPWQTRTSNQNVAETIVRKQTWSASIFEDVAMLSRISDVYQKMQASTVVVLCHISKRGIRRCFECQCRYVSRNKKWKRDFSCLHRASDWLILRVKAHACVCQDPGCTFKIKDHSPFLAPKTVVSYNTVYFTAQGIKNSTN